MDMSLGISGKTNCILIVYFCRCRLKDSDRQHFVCAQCEGVFTDPPTGPGLDADDEVILCRK